MLLLLLLMIYLETPHPFQALDFMRLFTFVIERMYHCSAEILSQWKIKFSFYIWLVLASYIDFSKKLNITSLPAGSTANQSTVINRNMTQKNGNKTSGTF